ncbi:MAG: hypothetical protein WCL32_08630 [Planctomycetota bacterium]
MSKPMSLILMLAINLSPGLCQDIDKNSLHGFWVPYRVSSSKGKNSEVALPSPFFYDGPSETVTLIIRTRGSGERFFRLRSRIEKGELQYLGPTGKWFDIAAVADKQFVNNADDVSIVYRNHPYNKNEGVFAEYFIARPLHDYDEKAR